MLTWVTTNHVKIMIAESPRFSTDRISVWSESAPKRKAKAPSWWVQCIEFIDRLWSDGSLQDLDKKRMFLMKISVIPGNTSINFFIVYKAAPSIEKWREHRSERMTRWNRGSIPYLNRHWWTSWENSGVERIMLKELGKLPPYLRNKEDISPLLEAWDVSQNWGWRLFTKNTGLCEVVTRCIGSDTCPVLET